MWSLCWWFGSEHRQPAVNRPWALKREIRVSPNLTRPDPRCGNPGAMVLWARFLFRIFRRCRKFALFPTTIFVIFWVRRWKFYDSSPGKCQRSCGFRLEPPFANMGAAILVVELAFARQAKIAQFWEICSFFVQTNGGILLASTFWCGQRQNCGLRGLILWNYFLAVRKGLARVQRN